MTLYRGHTRVSASASIAQVQRLLAAAGARSITTDYSPQDTRLPVAMSFELIVNNAQVKCRLPIRIDAVFDKLQEARPVKTRGTAPTIKVDRERAVDVAWRQAFCWLEAQLAFIDTGQVQPIEVMLPYVIGKTGKTVFEQLAGQDFKALPLLGKD